MTRTVVAVAGMPGTRKSLFAAKLAQLGYKHITLSDFLKKRLKDQGASDEPSELWRESIAIRKSLGDDILARLAWQELLDDSAPYIVIDGVRCLPEVCYLQQRAGTFVLVTVQASLHRRYTRILDRPDGFYADDPDRIIQLDAHELKLGMGSLVALSDWIIFVENLNREELHAFMMDQAKALQARISAGVYDVDAEMRARSRHYFQVLTELLHEK